MESLKKRWNSKTESLQLNKRSHNTETRDFSGASVFCYNLVLSCLIYLYIIIIIINKCVRPRVNTRELQLRQISHSNLLSWGVIWQWKSSKLTPWSQCWSVAERETQRKTAIIAPRDTCMVQQARCAAVENRFDYCPLHLLCGQMFLFCFFSSTSWSENVWA